MHRPCHNAVPSLQCYGNFDKLSIPRGRGSCVEHQLADDDNSWRADDSVARNFAAPALDSMHSMWQCSAVAADCWRPRPLAIVVAIVAVAPVPSSWPIAGPASLPLAMCSTARWCYCVAAAVDPDDVLDFAM